MGVVWAFAVDADFPFSGQQFWKEGTTVFGEGAGLGTREKG